MVQSIIEKEDEKEIVSTLNTVSIFEQDTPEKMVEEQCKDQILELAYQYITAGKKVKPLAITKIKSKAV